MAVGNRTIANGDLSVALGTDSRAEKYTANTVAYLTAVTNDDVTRGVVSVGSTQKNSEFARRIVNVAGGVDNTMLQTLKQQYATLYSDAQKVSKELNETGASSLTQQQVNTQAKRLDVADELLKTHPADINTNAADIKTNTANIAKTNERLDGVSETVVGHTTQIEENTASIESLQQSMSDFMPSVTNRMNKLN
ncbi:hypothetical protein [Acinetobacter terrae]|nr:hypothetical protein [Acinetobacter terrae]OAL85461.1 hypothetical protein AY608_03300 [Acinetobacter terrae]